MITTFILLLILSVAFQGAALFACLWWCERAERAIRAELQLRRDIERHGQFIRFRLAEIQRENLQDDTADADWWKRGNGRN